MKFRNLGWSLVMVTALTLGGRAAAVANDPPPIYLESVPGGYHITLNRTTAELLSDLLQNADEKDISGLIRDEAQKRKDLDADTAATLELIAVVVNGQMPAFKKQLKEKLGPKGVIIKVKGLQKNEVKFKNRRLNRLIGVVHAVTPLLPAEAQITIEAVRSMARTTPLIWKIEPLE